jgi:hypothetical protein
MKMRHKKADGGKVPESADYKESKGSGKAKSYSAPSNVESEAKDEEDGGEMKKGGRVKKRADGGKVEGCSPKMRLDRAKRKSGGRVGSDMSPFSSAHGAKAVVDHKTDD